MHKKDCSDQYQYFDNNHHIGKEKAREKTYEGEIIIRGGAMNNKKTMQRQRKRKREGYIHANQHMMILRGVARWRGMGLKPG